jgi:hypothetical protein
LNQIFLKKIGLGFGYFEGLGFVADSLIVIVTCWFQFLVFGVAYLV